MTLDASQSSGIEGIVSLEWDCDGDGVFEAEGDWTVAKDKTHVCTYELEGIFEATVQATNALVRVARDSKQNGTKAEIAMSMCRCVGREAKESKLLPRDKPRIALDNGNNTCLTIYNSVKKRPLL